MIQYQTLTEMLDHRSRGPGAIGYLEGEGAEKTLPLASLRQRALGILHHLQRIGARPGDMLILHVASNEQFIDAFWACLYGGIVPVPVAVGISDEHKHKLLRIARQLGKPFLYTDRKLRERLGDFRRQRRASPAAWTALEPRTFLIDQLDDISREGTPARVDAASRRRSSSSRRAPPASPRAWCSRTATSSPMRRARARRPASTRTTCRSAGCRSPTTWA